MFAGDSSFVWSVVHICPSWCCFRDCGVNGIIPSFKSSYGWRGTIIWHTCSAWDWSCTFFCFKNFGKDARCPEGNYKDFPPNSYTCRGCFFKAHFLPDIMSSILSIFCMWILKYCQIYNIYLWGFISMRMGVPMFPITW